MPTFTVAIRGTKFRPREAKEIAKNLAAAEPVRIVPEPDNAYDPNALQIHAQGHFIGYVQKDMAEWIAARIEEEAEGYVSENFDPQSGLRLIEVTL